MLAAGRTTSVLRRWSAALTVMAVTATGLATGVVVAPSAAANAPCEGASSQFTAAGMVVCEQRFLTSGSWKVPSGITTADVVVVGGGGGGSGSNASELLAGNGGGAGHVVVETVTPVSGVVSVTVGSGGRGGAGDTSGSDANGQDGRASSFGGIVAPAGTGGQGNSPGALGSGGSSGRSVDGSSVSTGDGGMAMRQGTAGVKGGGGWGAGGRGAGVGGLNRTGLPDINAVKSTSSWVQTGMGGNGYRPDAGLFAYNFTTYFGGGGGGGAAVSGGTDGFGGVGGGGLGGWSSNITDAAANTGGGGGGAGLRNRVGYPVETKPSGNGASGIVIVRWVAPPSITTVKLGTAVDNEPFSQQLIGTGAPALTWTITEGELPSGLVVAEDGLITGTPSVAESSSIELTVLLTDALGRETTKTLTMLAVLPLQIETATLPDGQADEDYPATTLLAKGGIGDLRWAATGLPAGMSLSTAGELSGTPGEGGVFSVVVTVTDMAGRKQTATLSLGIGVAAPLTASAALGSGSQDVAYQGALAASGGTEPYAWQLTSGALPPGLALSPNGDIIGTPTAAGVFTFTATVTDGKGQSVDVIVDLTIEPAALSAQAVPICHRTDDGYELVMTTESVLNGRGEHGDHSGDIVPELVGVAPGRNWGPEQITLFFNGCLPPEDEVLDTDADGLVDEVDADDDGDGLADVADPDDDGDGVEDVADPDSVPAPDQDEDGLPDALDPDDDGDCVLDATDADRDGDGIANRDDGDIDNDGLPNAVDLDADGDGVTNLLDVDGDGNGVAAGFDADDASGTRSAGAEKGSCAFEKDADGDGLPNTKDPDDDGDGVLDEVDVVEERPWIDTDSDGIPNVADVDVDGDGIPNEEDQDRDGDNVPDRRDVDDDGDGLVDTRSASGAGTAARPVRATTTVTFAPMSDVLSAGAKAQLRGLMKKAGRSPSTVVSIGYVQQSGTSANDKQLSSARATAAAQYLGSLGVKAVYTVRGDGVGGPGPDARKVVVSVVTPG